LLPNTHHHELHLSGFDFLAKKLGGSPDHHSNEKNRKDCERNLVDQADADATEHIIEQGCQIRLRGKPG
jgi:hypothetical protein